MATNNDEDYNSSDDEDYVPPVVVPDEKDDLGYDDVDDDLINKKAKQKKSKNVEVIKNPDEEKKRIDDLWNDFLTGTQPVVTPAQPTKLGTLATIIPMEQQPKAEIKTKKTTFVFAGEEVTVDQPQPSFSSNSTKNKSTKRVSTPKVKVGEGLAIAAKLLSKRPKMSVLDKTDHDWKQFVSEEGINDDLKSHSRSKNAFLDRQDFLLKADYLQFENEKALRQIERGKQKK